MALVAVEQMIDASVSEVWKAWDNFGGIDAFNPNLKRSFLLDGSAPSGVGATRQCDFADGKNYIRERIIAYKHENYMKVDIYEGTVPLKEATAQIELSPVSAGKTRLRFTIRFVPKFGLLGRFLIPMMKPQFRKDITALLVKNATFVEARG